jgi:hypothetical protein
VNPEDYDIHTKYLSDLEREVRMKQEDPMPEFKTGEEAYEWMEQRLNKSWVDEIFDEPKVEVTFPANPGSGSLSGGTMTKAEFEALMGLGSIDDSSA